METLTKDYFTDRLENSATIVLPDQGSRVTAGDGSCTFKVTSEMSKGMLGIYEIVVPPHTVGARLHFHRFMDEVFIIKKGVLTIELFKDKHDLPEGSTVYVPRFTPHGFSNTSDDEVKIILIFNPSEQREGYFKGLFELLNAEEMDVDLFQQLSLKYDSYPLNTSAL